MTNEQESEEKTFTFDGGRSVMRITRTGALIQVGEEQAYATRQEIMQICRLIAEATIAPGPRRIEIQVLETKPHTFCAVCGEPQYISPGGDTCSNGHGAPSKERGA